MPAQIIWSSKCHSLSLSSFIFWRPSPSAARSFLGVVTACIARQQLLLFPCPPDPIKKDDTMAAKKETSRNGAGIHLPFTVDFVS
jgi:hypothetical protein